MHWTCPHCGILANLQAGDMKHGITPVLIRLAPNNEVMGIRFAAVRCPSSACNKYTLDVWANFGDAIKFGDGSRHQNELKLDKDRPVGIGHMRFEPRMGVPLSSHVPTAVREDYEEACSIKDLSPKAAATLCRRALQGMVRDFCGVHERTLHDELKRIEAQCDQELFKALMGIKSIGNIGAHPEVDINLIVEVEPGEVDALIGALKILDEEWYVSRADRAARLAAVHMLSTSKAAAKTANAAASPAPPSAP
jgi:hypothetical protein